MPEFLPQEWGDGPYPDPLNKKHVFVFGSNLAGRHGKGAARHALAEWGAEYGVGSGLRGQSYAFPTKDHKLRVLSLVYIRYVSIPDLYVAISCNPGKLFFITRVGCGLAGYKASTIAPLLTPVAESFPDQVIFNAGFKEVLKL